MRPLGRAQHKFELDTHRPGHMFEHNIWWIACRVVYQMVISARIVETKNIWRTSLLEETSVKNFQSRQISLKLTKMDAWTTTWSKEIKKIKYIRLQYIHVWTFIFYGVEVWSAKPITMSLSEESVRLDPPIFLYLFITLNMQKNMCSV